MRLEFFTYMLAVIAFFLLGMTVAMETEKRYPQEHTSCKGKIASPLLSP